MASALHRRERQAFGGAIQWEAAFFGMLAAIGLATMLVGMTAAAGVAVGLTEFREPAADQLEELSFAGGALLVMLVGISLAAGGYVAARMARFDGWRQGLGVWALTVLMGVAVAVAVWIAAGELNPLDSLSVPELPVEEGPLGAAPGIALAVTAVVALISAIAGGLLGERFHRAVDEAGTRIIPAWEQDDETRPAEPEGVPDRGDPSDRDERVLAGTGEAGIDTSDPEPRHT
jgi:hypothetical protein